MIAMEKDQGTETETERDGMPSEINAQTSTAGVQIQPAVGAQSAEATAEEQQAKQPRGSVFEGIYDHLPDISVRSVDRFIVICVIALVMVILIGILKANHVF